MDRDDEHPPWLTYVADPMCSWCYAFGPELDRIVEATGLPVRLIMGGLFVGAQTQPLDDRLRSYLNETWDRVHQMSGRPFDRQLLAWSDWTYDTEPACRAVAAVRERDPAASLGYFKRLQVGFYAENLDLTKAEVLVRLASELGLDGDADGEVQADAHGDVEVDVDAEVEVEAEVAGAGSSRTSPLQDFAWTRARGIRSFPTLLLTVGHGSGRDRPGGGPDDSTETIVVAAGFKRAEAVIRTITTLVARP